MLDLIQSIEKARKAYDAKDDQAVVAVLNEPSIAIPHREKRDRDWLAKTLGPDEARKVLATLRASDDELVQAEYYAVNSSGVDLSTDLRQGLIAQLGRAARWSPETIQKLLAAGVTRTSPAQQALGRDVTLEDVSRARIHEDLKGRVAKAYNAVIAAIDAGEVVDTDGAKAAFAAEVS